MILQSRRFFLPLILLLISSSVQAEPLESKKNKLSYALGAYFGTSIVQQNLNEDLDIPSFLKAVEDVLNNMALSLSDDEMKRLLLDFQKESLEKRKASSDRNRQAGDAFLEENAKKEEVTRLASGLQYELVQEGSGAKPTADAEVTVHYHGTLVDGTVFDSSYERGEPIKLSLNNVIKGWQEALVLMPVGSKWRLYIPADLAYGESGSGSIGPNQTLIFDVELLSIH